MAPTRRRFLALLAGTSAAALAGPAVAETVTATRRWRFDAPDPIVVNLSDGYFTYVIDGRSTWECGYRTRRLTVEDLLEIENGSALEVLS